MLGANQTAQPSYLNYMYVNFELGGVGGKHLPKHVSASSMYIFLSKWNGLIS